MSAPALDRMDLEMDLRSAITNRDFRLHYQRYPLGRGRASWI